MLKKAQGLLDGMSGLLGAKETLAQNKELLSAISGLREESEKMDRDLKEACEAFAALHDIAVASVQGDEVEFKLISGEATRSPDLARKIVRMRAKCMTEDVPIGGNASGRLDF